MLLVNRTNTQRTFKLAADLQNGSMLTVDENTGDDPPHTARISGDELKMAPFAVTILSLE